MPAAGFLPRLGQIVDAARVRVQRVGGITATTVQAALQTLDTALAFTRTNQAPNTFYAGPASGPPAPPTFRGLSAADLAPQRLVTGSGNLPLVATDSIINLNCTSGPLTITLLPYASRAGAPLTFSDVGGQAGTNNITINRATTASIENMDGLSTMTLNTNYQTVTLTPANDGTTTGWKIR